MSSEAGPSPSRRLFPGVLAVVAAGAAVGLGWFLVTGTTHLPPKQQRVQSAAQPADVGFDAAREAFLREPTLVNSQTYLQQLNEDLQRHPERQPAALSEQEQRLLYDTYKLSSNDLRTEIESTSFTAADAYYLEACALLSAALHSLPLEGASDRDRARLCFEWVTRQVRLNSNEPDFLAQHHLKRGWGSAFARRWVFLASLEQLGIPGCTVRCPEKKGGKFYLFTGALADGQIYLFDLEIALPLPGKAPGEVATLAQLEAQPELLQSMTVENEAPYDFDPRDRDIRPSCSVSVAPPMRVLEERLAFPQPLRLRSNLFSIHQQWVKAVGGRLLTPRDRFDTEPMHSALYSPLYWALLSLRRPEDRGSTTPARETPGLRFYMSLVAWDRLPAPIQSLEGYVDPGARLRALFAAPFENFYLKPGSPRDLLIRGRLNEAAAALVELSDQLQEVRRQAGAMPNLEATVTEWCRAARKAQADRLASRGKGPESQAAEERWQQLWSKEQVTPVLLLLHSSAAEPLGVEVEYQLALCKHEQAERLQILLDRKQADGVAVRDAWRTAADRWQKFLDDHPRAPGEGSARLLGARALEMLGERAAALALVQESEHLPPWDRRACRYRAKLLTATPKK